MYIEIISPLSLSLSKLNKASSPSLISYDKLPVRLLILIVLSCMSPSLWLLVQFYVLPQTVYMSWAGCIGLDLQKVLET